MNNLPRMRTVQQAFAELKAADPNTALTERALRAMVKLGEVPSVHIGSKTLVNMDVLTAHLQGQTVSAPVIGEIRRIEG